MLMIIAGGQCSFKPSLIWEGLGSLAPVDRCQVSSWSSGAGGPGKRGALQGANSVPAHEANVASTQPW